MTQKITDAINPLAESALCAWFGTEAIQRAVPWVTLGTGLIPTPATKAASLALVALQYGCSFKPDLTPDYIESGCWERATPTLIQYYDPNYNAGEGSWISSFLDTNFEQPVDRVYEILSVVGTVVVTDPDSGIQSLRQQLRLRFWDNSEATVTQLQGVDVGQQPFEYFRLFDNGSECLKPAPNSEKPDPPAPINQYSSDLNCNFQAVLNGFQLQEDGTARPVITYKSLGAQGTNGPDPNADISGCNWFGDLVYRGPSNCDCPEVYPLPPNPPQVPVPPSNDDCPDPCPEIKPEIVGESKFLMTAPCEKDAEGNNLEWEKTVALGQGLPAIAARLEALSEQVSQALTWKTPVCGNEKPTLEGNWRTISFRSDSTSPYGKSRLCKRFRYRSTSGLGLGEIVDHWKDFTFRSGPVVVCHSGSSWGTPQVWASTADEGKRVIRHAAGEAGINPDQVGRWTISSSDSARYGVSDTMRVDTKGGYYWITSRDGSDGKPIVAI